MALCLKCRSIQQTHWVRRRLKQAINTRKNTKKTYQEVKSNLMEKVKRNGDGILVNTTAMESIRIFLRRKRKINKYLVNY